jgi:hypothetical protein
LSQIGGVVRVGVELKGFRGLGRACENFFTTTRVTKQRHHHHDQCTESTFDGTSTCLGNRPSLEYRRGTYRLFAVGRNPLGSREKVFTSILLNLLSTEPPVWFHGTNTRLLYTYSRCDTNHDRGVDEGWDMRKVALGASIGRVSRTCF